MGVLDIDSVLFFKTFESSVLHVCVCVPECDVNSYDGW